jgi:hypothetical protein
MVAVWAVCFVATGLASFWAALGTAPPLRRAPVVIALALTLGAFFAVAVGADRDGCVYIALIMLLYPAVLLASLLIVRSCGYRLVSGVPFSWRSAATEWLDKARQLARPHGELVPMPTDRRLIALAGAHGVLGILASAAAPAPLPSAFRLDAILVVFVVAAALCQGFLIAFWAASSPALPWKRLVGLVAGLVYAEALLPPAFRLELLGLPLCTVLLSAATLLAGRQLGFRLVRQADGVPAAPVPSNRFRFSIRDLMVVTAVVAVLAAGARAMQERQSPPVVMIVLWAICGMAVGLVCVRAALSHTRPIWRLPTALLAGLAVGGSFALASNAGFDGQVYITLSMVLDAAGLLASLCFLRWCGYRFVRRAFATNTQPLAEVPTTG